MILTSIYFITKLIRREDTDDLYFVCILGGMIETFIYLLALTPFIIK
jgi:hypothetical protein